MAEEILQKNFKGDRHEKRNHCFSEENQELSDTLRTTQSQLEQIGQDYANLKNDSAEFLKIKSNYDRVSNQLTEETTKAQQLQNEVDQLKRNQFINKFLAGAGVLLVGFIIGFVTKRQRRRSSLLQKPNRFRIKLLAQYQGGPAFQPAGIRHYVEVLKRGLNAEMGPKDNFETASSIAGPLPNCLNSLDLVVY